MEKELEIDLEELQEEVSERVFDKLKNDELLRRTEKPAMTREEISQVADPKKRIQLIRENITLYK